jgi:hypothetical protein
MFKTRTYFLNDDDILEEADFIFIYNQEGFYDVPRCQIGKTIGELRTRIPSVDVVIREEQLI